MSNKLLIPSIVIVAIVGGVVFYMLTSSSSQEQAINRPQDSNNAAGTIEEGSEQMVDASDNPIEDDSNSETDRYMTYSQQAFDSAAGKKRVYFFHASWCPTCKVVNEEFEAEESRIPQDVVLFKTDYDTEKDLKQKYAITYQHTFVLVDENGNELAKWNGGGIDELMQNIN